MKTVLIFGANGQDGSYLSELCLAREDKVIGVVRRSSTNNKERLNSFLHNPNLIIEEGDITDSVSVNELINKYRPNEVYNTAAQSHVATSFSQPSYTFTVDCIGVLNILEAIRVFSPQSRFVQSSTSEMFGANASYEYDIQGCLARFDGLLDIKSEGYKNRDSEAFQDEDTPFSPNSPYAIAKVAAFNLVQLYRKSYNLFACNAIMFNHESPRRGELFVTRKITKWIGQFKKWTKINPEYFTNEKYDLIFTAEQQLQEFPKLKLGYIDAYRDWGHAKDYCRAEMMILAHDKPEDFVVATGETHTVKEFLSVAFEEAGLGNWADYVVIDPSLYRPCEVPYLLGKSTKIQTMLGWKPEIDFEALVKEMVQHDIQTA